MGSCSSSSDWDKHLHLRQTPLDGALSYNEIEGIIGFFSLHTFDNKQVIVKEGSVSDSLYAIVSGVAEMVLKATNADTAAASSSQQKALTVTVGVNNFIGGFGLVHIGDDSDDNDDAKPQTITEPMTVVGKNTGMYVKITRQQYLRIKSLRPNTFEKLKALIGLRLAALREIPFFNSVTENWPPRIRHTFASLFRYQSFSEHKELIAEAGKAADRLIILFEGEIHLTNIRRGGDTYAISERGRLVNLTSLFYNEGQINWDILAQPSADKDKTTKVMYLNRVEFLKFVSCGLVDCKLRFEQATIEYLIREMKTENRLFFSLLKEEEQHIQHFAKLCQLREYGQSVKIATSVADGNWEAKDQPHTNATTTSNHNNTNNNNNDNNSSSNISWSRANSVPQKAIFHVVVGGSVDAYSSDSLMSTDRQMKKAHRQEFFYGSGIGVLSINLRRYNSDLTYFSGQTKCLMITVEKDDFDAFFKKIGKHEEAIALAEREIINHHHQQLASATHSDDHYQQHHHHPHTTQDSDDNGRDRRDQRRYQLDDDHADDYAVHCGHDNEQFKRMQVQNIIDSVNKDGGVNRSSKEDMKFRDYDTVEATTI